MVRISTDVYSRHTRGAISGKPTYNFRGRLRFALQLILGYSTRLLYVAIAMGIIMSLISFALAIDIIIYKLTNPELPFQAGRAS